MRTSIRFPLQAGIKNAPALAGVHRRPCDAAARRNCDVQDVLINARKSSTFFVPYRGYTTMQWITNTASASYDSLQASYLRPPRGTWTGDAGGFRLVLHSIDDSSDGAFLTGVDDWNNLSRWRGNSEFRPPPLIAVELRLRSAVPPQQPAPCTQERVGRLAGERHHQFPQRSSGQLHL